MSSIDNRIVNMQFNNGQFNAGVEQTNKALKGLKSNLELDGVAKDVENISSKFSLLGAVGFATINTLVQKTIDSGLKIAKNLIDPIIKGGQKRAQNLEQSRFQLMGLLKDEVKVASVMEDVNYAVDGTAYGLDAAAMAAASLAASNIEAGEQMKNYLRGISGVAAMTSSSYEDISNVFTKVAGQGRVMGDDFRRLEARGMNAAAAIAKHFGYTEAEVREMASKSLISADMFAEAMNTAFGPHASKANETYAGSLSNVKAALARLGEQYYLGTDRENANGYYERQRQLFVALIPQINAVGNALRPIMTAYNELASARRAKLVSWVENLDLSGLVLVGENIGQSMRNMSVAVKSYLEPIKRAFKNVFGDVSFSLMDGLQKFSAFIERFTGSLKLGADGASFVESAFTGLFKVLKVFVDIGKNAFDVLRNLGKGLTGTLDPLKDSLSGAAEGATTFLEVIQNVGRGLYNFVTEGLTRVSPVIKTVFGGLFDILGEVGRWLKDNITFKDLLAGLMAGGVYSVLSSIAGLFDKARDAAKSFSDFFSKDGVKKVSGFAGVLEEVKNSLKAFTGGLNLFSLVTVAAAVALLSSSIRQLSEIDVTGLAPALAAVGAVLAMLSANMKSMSAVIKTFAGKGLLAASGSMLFVAGAIVVMSHALSKLAKLSPTEIVNGLTALTVMMVQLNMFMNATNFDGLTLGNAVAILGVAIALSMVAKSLEKLAQLSWEETAKGLTGMAGAMYILSKTVTSLNGLKIGLKAITSVLILANTLNIVARAMSSLAELSWDGIARGLTGMTGAMYIMVYTTKAIDAIDGANSMKNAVSILVLSLTLKLIANALDQISSLSWEGLTKGLTGLLGAMLIMSHVLTTMNTLGAGTSIKNATSILVLSLTLKSIANALVDIGGMSWEEVTRGLTGMAGALAALVGTIAIFEKLQTGANSLWGAGSLLVGVISLRELAKALQIFGEMSWSEIGRGLAAMGGALTELSLAIGLLGYFAGPFALLGGGALWVGVQGLGKLAEALQIFGSMSWDEIGRGLSAMAGALAVIAVGSFINTLSIIGSLSISAVAKPLGQLAESLKKWQGLKLPDDIIGQLGRMSYAISQFTFAFIGAEGIKAVAEPLGTLADSAQKWNGVKLPSNLKENLSDLADGVSSFNWKMFAGWSLSTVATPFGKLADSVKKWDSVKVPPNIKEDLTKLGSGLESFNWKMFAGWSLSTIVEPFAKLAESVTAWKDVSVPDDIAKSLGNLAEGIGKFDWKMFAGWSLSTIVGPFKDLARAVQAWDDVTISNDLKDGLVSLSEGLNSFQWAFFVGSNLEGIVTPFRNLADAVDAWSDVKVNPNLESDLQSLQRGLHVFQWEFFTGDNIHSIAEPFKKLGDAVNSWKNVSVNPKLEDDLMSLQQGLNVFQLEFFTGGNLSSIAGPFGELADATKKWCDVELPDDIGDTLSDLADGVNAFQLEFFTGGNLNSIAGPFGVLAESVKKWRGVELPDNIGEMLESLARGVNAFKWEFFTGGNLNSIAGPFGVLAESVKKWRGVELPDNIGEMLSDLAEGVNAFQLEFFTGGNLDSIAGPFGDLADAVNAWADVSIPPNIEEDLKSLDRGISSFQWSFFTGGNVNSIVEPFRDLAGAVKEWRGVSISPDITEGLTRLSTTLKDFPSDGKVNDITKLVEPLSSLRDALQGWGDVDAYRVGSHIWKLAEGLDYLGMVQINDAIENILSDLAASVSEWTLSMAESEGSVSTWANNVAGSLTIVQGASSAFSSFMKTDVDDINASFSSLSSTIGATLIPIESRFTSFKSTVSVNMSAISTAITSGSTSVATAISRLSTASQPLTVLGTLFTRAASGVTTGMTSMRAAIVTSSVGIVVSLKTLTTNMSTNLVQMRTSIATNTTFIIESFTVLQTALTKTMSMIVVTINSGAAKVVASITRMASGIRSGINAASSAISSSISAMVSRINSTLSSASASMYAGGHRVGAAISQGMTAGILSSSSSAISAASSVATRALQSAKSALGVASPSKEFMKLGEFAGIGLTIGLKDQTKQVARAGETLGDSAIFGVVGAMDELQKLIDSGIIDNPVITPELNLEILKNQALRIEDLFSASTTMTLVNAASRGYESNREMQAVNESLRDEEPVTKINFTQNNTSPKALSTADIYRQTRNQLAIVKKGLPV